MEYNFKLLQLNPTPVLILDFNTDIISKQDFDTISKIPLKYSFDNLKFSKSHSILKEYNLYNIKYYFDTAIKHYLNDVLLVNDNFELIHSWLTINYTGSNHHNHNHTNSMLSAVTYFDNNLLRDTIFSPLNIELDGTDTIFPNFKFELQLKEANEINAKMWKIFPKSNQIIIFPSHLFHSSDKYTGPSSRWCIGTNYFFSGISGRKNDYTYIDINLNHNS